MFNSHQQLAFRLMYVLRLICLMQKRDSFCNGNAENCKIHICVPTGSFSILCPDGYGYVKEMIGDLVKGENLLDFCSETSYNGNAANEIKNGKSRREGLFFFFHRHQRMHHAPRDLQKRTLRQHGRFVQVRVCARFYPRQTRHRMYW